MGLQAKGLMVWMVKQQLRSLGGELELLLL